MFVSQPHYHFPFPPDLAQPGSQHWRMVELTLHTPWFLLSVEIVDAKHREQRFVRTLCIGWENDLVDVLRSIDGQSVKGIVCMMPAWQSATGQWSSREVREVWCHRSAGGHSVVLRDADGHDFDCGLGPDHVEPVEKELLLQLVARKPRDRTPQTASRRSRRAAAQAATANP